MALTITQKLRGNLDGKAFRVYEITHDGTIKSVTANQMDMHYIEAIVGHIPIMSYHGATSYVVDFRPSIAANHESIQWLSTAANDKSQVSVLGW